MKKNSEADMVNYFQIIEQIANKVKKCKLSEELIFSIKSDLQLISDFMQISEIQTILFCVIMKLSFNSSVDIDDISKYLSCSPMKIISGFKDIKNLEKRGYIKRVVNYRARGKSYNDFCYEIPKNVYNAFLKKDNQKILNHSRLDITSLLSRVFELISDREENTIDSEDLFEEVEYLAKRNNRIPFVKYLNQNARTKIEKCLCIYLAYETITANKEVDLDVCCQMIFDELSDLMEFKNQLITGKMSIIRNGVMTYQPGAFRQGKYVMLTNKSVEILSDGNIDLMGIDTGGSNVIKTE